MLCQLSSMKPFLFLSGPSSQTLLASNHFHTGGGGGTPIYGLHRYVPWDRVWFLRFTIINRVAILPMLV